MQVYAHGQTEKQVKTEAAQQASLGEFLPECSIFKILHGESKPQ